MSVNKLKYFFAVDTRYVLKKLMILMFPYTHQVIIDPIERTARHKTLIVFRLRDNKSYFEPLITLKPNTNKISSHLITTQASFMNIIIL